MLLSDSEIGKQYRLLNVDRLGANLRQRLSDMGLVNCNFVVVINNRGLILIDLRGTRLAIGRGMTQKIEVEEIND